MPGSSPTMARREPYDFIEQRGFAYVRASDYGYEWKPFSGRASHRI